jgi:hypothetical protein
MTLTDEEFYYLLSFLNEGRSVIHSMVISAYMYNTPYGT